jgi:protein SCO1/2
VLRQRRNDGFVVPPLGGTARLKPVLRTHQTAVFAVLLFLTAGAAAVHADPPGLRQDWDLTVGAFTLEERGGALIGPEALRGKVWVAHFFYPGCQGPCTKTVPTMKRLHDAVAAKTDYVLVSIALNDDSPELLRQFAHDHGADPRRWLFLTGPSDQVHDIVQKCFFQTAQRKSDGRPGDEIDHTVNLMIVDRTGAIRGYVDGTDVAVVPLVVERLRELAAPRYLLPAGNAVLNTMCTVLLVVGWLSIRRRRETLHTVCMLAALATSTVFLASYLYFHFAVLDGQPTRFRGEGWVRPLYFAILLSHTVLAALVAPLAVYVAWQGLRDHRPRHVRVARWTMPIWLYVSITGVVVYVLLYQVYPPY